MESKIGEANSRIIIFGWYEHIPVGISFSLNEPVFLSLRSDLCEDKRYPNE
jgi:hypothetical protein